MKSYYDGFFLLFKTALCCERRMFLVALECLKAAVLTLFRQTNFMSGEDDIDDLLLEAVLIRGFLSAAATFTTLIGL